MNTLKKIKSTLKFFGFELKRHIITQNQQLRLSKLMNDQKINLVFDVGANSGQFGQELRENGYSSEIISFEPLSEPFEKLIETSKNDDKWHINKCAIGDIDGEIQVNIAGNSASSSIREMLPSHYNASPESLYIGNESVEIYRLESIFRNYVKDDSNVFLKIDTQGYEENVIIGSKDILNNIKIIQMELSLIELYSGQKLFIDMLKLMADTGFSLWSLDPAFINPQNGQMLQLDAVFINYD